MVRLLVCACLVGLPTMSAGLSLSGAAVPLVVTTLLLGVLALVLATSDLAQPQIRAARAWAADGHRPHAADRQCNPDAAGHVRPRAPGMSPDLSAAF